MAYLISSCFVSCWVERQAFFTWSLSYVCLYLCLESEKNVILRYINVIITKLFSNGTVRVVLVWWWSLLRTKIIRRENLNFHQPERKKVTWLTIDWIDLTLCNTLITHLILFLCKRVPPRPGPGHKDQKDQVVPSCHARSHVSTHFHMMSQAKSIKIFWLIFSFILCAQEAHKRIQVSLLSKKRWIVKPKRKLSLTKSTQNFTHRHYHISIQCYMCTLAYSYKYIHNISYQMIIIIRLSDWYDVKSYRLLLLSRERSFAISVGFYLFFLSTFSFSLYPHKREIGKREKLFLFFCLICSLLSYFAKLSKIQKPSQFWS